MSERPEASQKTIIGALIRVESVWVIAVGSSCCDRKSKNRTRRLEATGSSGSSSAGNGDGEKKHRTEEKEYVGVLGLYLDRTKSRNSVDVESMRE